MADEDDEDRGYDRDDLFKLLDLKGEQADEVGEIAVTTVDPKRVKSLAKPTDHALSLDEFGKRQGKEVLIRNSELRDLGMTHEEVADFYGAAFERAPELTEACKSYARRTFMEQLLSTPDFNAMHAATTLDAAASEAAAIEIAKQWQAIKPSGDKELDEYEALAAAGKACDAAAMTVEELHEALRMMGEGKGSKGGEYSPVKALGHYRRLRGNAAMRRICEAAGRFRRVAQSKQRQKSTHGYDDMVGVELGGDLGRLLPYEKAKLSIPEFEDDTLRRIVEREAMCRDYKSIEKIGKGPIIVTIDESSSMCGDKVETAKAIGLTMAYIAKQQRRWCGLIAYSGETGSRLLQLKPSKWDETLVLNWIEEFIGGGSNRDVPIEEMPQFYEWLAAPKGKTDVILITDAICRIPQDMSDRFIAWKQRVQARVISLIIQSRPGDLAALSDEVFELPSLSADEAGVARILSL